MPRHEAVNGGFTLLSTNVARSSASREHDFAGSRMRTILAAAILVVGVTSAPTEADFFPRFAAASHPGSGEQLASLFEIESSSSRGDRLVVASAETVPAVSFPERFYIPAFALDDEPDTNPGQPLSVGDLCTALLTSAQNNDIPVAFFANLLWQESGLRNDIVSRKGALGIAQFMPETAVESGLDDPTVARTARTIRQSRLRCRSI